MEQTPVQILEVRAAEADRPVTVTLAIIDVASQAIFASLSEQLDRRRRDGTETAEDVLALRDRSALLERFEPLATAEAHAVLSLSTAELRSCLLDLTEYADRVDGDHYQPVDLRERISLIAEITPVLWDANAAAAAAEQSLAEAAPLP